MKNPIIITFEKKLNIKELFAKAKRDAEKYDIPFTGDENGGSGEKYGVKGYFTIKNDHLIITVEEKPWILSEARIRKEVLNYCKDFFAA